MGSNMDTLKIESNGMAFLKFHAKDLIDEIKELSGAFIMDIVGRANLNEWGGRITPQIFIDDYEIKKSNINTF